MGERGILFSAPMVRAIIEGRKTQTRRAISEATLEAYSDYDDWCRSVSAGVPSSRQWEREYFLERHRIKVGDVLWVREAWRADATYDDESPREIGRTATWYEADGHFDKRDWHRHSSGRGRLRSGIHMPRWASRLTLRVTDVRVERLAEISEADAIAEGIAGGVTVGGPRDGQRHYHLYSAKLSYETTLDPLESYRSLWEAINGPGSWDANPWVAAYTFERVPS